MKKTQYINRNNSINMDIKPRLISYPVLQLEDNLQEKDDVALEKLDEMINLNGEELIINDNNGETAKDIDFPLKSLQGQQNKNSEQTQKNDDNDEEEEFKLQEIPVEVPSLNLFENQQKGSENLITLGNQLSQFELKQQDIKAETSRSQKQFMELKQLLNTFDNIKIVKKDNISNPMLSLTDLYSKGKIIEVDTKLAYKATKELKQPKGFFQHLFGKATRYLIFQYRVLLICEKQSQKNIFCVRSVCPLSELLQMYNDKNSEHIRLYFINKKKTVSLLPRCKEFDIKNKQGFLVELKEQVNTLGLDFSFGWL